MAAIRAMEALVRGTALASLQAVICEARGPSGRVEAAGRFPAGTPGPLRENLREAAHT